MKVVLDTNVLVAAFATRGLCASLVEYCLKEVDIVLSEPLLQETIKALLNKIKLPARKAEGIKQFLLKQARIVTPVALPSPICRDVSDDRVLATAKAGHVDFIITGDDDLLVLKAFEGIEILSPRDFVKMLTRKSK